MRHRDTEDIVYAIRDEVRLRANEEAAAMLTMEAEGPHDMEALESYGFDPDSSVRVARVGDAIAVAGGVIPSRRELSRALDGLMKMDREDQWPLGEWVSLPESVSLPVHFVVNAVALDLGMPRNMVHEVFEEVYEDELRAGRNRDTLYWESDSGKVSIYARLA